MGTNLGQLPIIVGSDWIFSNRAGCHGRGGDIVAANREGVVPFVVDILGRHAYVAGRLNNLN